MNFVRILIVALALWACGRLAADEPGQTIPRGCSNFAAWRNNEHICKIEKLADVGEQLCIYVQENGQPKFLVAIKDVLRGFFRYPWFVDAQHDTDRMAVLMELGEPLSVFLRQTYRKHGASWVLESEKLIEHLNLEKQDRLVTARFDRKWDVEFYYLPKGRHFYRRKEDGSIRKMRIRDSEDVRIVYAFSSDGVARNGVPYWYVAHPSGFDIPTEQRPEEIDK